LTRIVDLGAERDEFGSGGGAQLDPLSVSPQKHVSPELVHRRGSAQHGKPDWPPTRTNNIAVVVDVHTATPVSGGCGQQLHPPHGATDQTPGPAGEPVLVKLP